MTDNLKEFCCPVLRAYSEFQNLADTGAGVTLRIVDPARLIVIARLREMHGCPGAVNGMTCPWSWNTNGASLVLREDLPEISAKPGSRGQYL